MSARVITFAWKRDIMANAIEFKGVDNIVEIGSRIEASGIVSGNKNSVIIKNSSFPASIKIKINGNNNKVFIDENAMIRDLTVVGGSHVRAHSTQLIIGKNFSVEANCMFLICTSGNSLVIGDNCLFSNNISIRCGETPHLIFDKNTGEYIDISEGVIIGNHVWVGEKAYITKNVTIGDECIVGACSVVTKRFDVTNAVIAGNPAKVVKKDIQWIKNQSFLQEGSKFKESLARYHAKYI